MTEDVPGYRVLEQVGEGGFSVVYRAHQERLDRMVALKVLSISAVDDAAMRRFQRECKITGRLSGHPNIVTVLDTGTTRSGRPYIVMEYFEHGALTDRLAREGPLAFAEVLRIGVKMAGALAATHETDVLHRDVKPQNVLLSRYGEPALADFGIARLVDSFDATHTQAFTPHHAAPEVLEGRPPGIGSDLYSLGSTLYQLLAGRPAFKGPPREGIAPLMLRILNDPPPPIPRPDVPRQVTDVIVRAMAKTPDERFASAVEFAQALQRVQAELRLPVTDVAHSGLGAPAVPDTGPRPSFPDTSAPPPVPAWAPTAQAPSLPAAAPPAPAPAPVPAPKPPPSPWAPNALPPRAPEAVLPQEGSRPAPQAAWPPAPAPPADDRHASGSSTTPHTTPQEGPHQTTWARPHDGPRRGLVVVAGIVLAGGLALGIGALALSGGGDGKGGTAAKSAPPSGTRTVPQGQATQAPPEPVPESQLAATRPRKVVARQVGRTAALLWALPPAARGLPLLVQQQPAGTQPIVSVKAGSQSATMPGLRPNTAHCFKVGAVLRLNQGRAPDVAWSAPACVGKAKKRTRP
ncbi:serine/threonine-protein kinase [Actinomadura mexicana]|uniref:non-specific serine/threonine protein kinase n=1 Tax=Actinomadura mexicana TaxID=134959 RepID=A0A239EHR3_9ACTN|nr:serine/threonine-protein kinase [Actinomadura mexicana]SNS44167.1 Serine/threonine protein kinase [Actinomadura mexicana]